ncbi:hypothetical protein Sta7437_0407 [Stanieria cyanosphaera PCC 7437]|uniref:DUF4236 domain-containing protein n=1 Tax=Stanieria cyanosphaera (strain ATCC 29371 / PCC 7437) TaxID=111780 RepID=K9XQT3_STAC7|nr:DUF4236 domain-containing protein [Stanieria cyanosphaera]AFZ34017.1 hypothetical protein Sta7437_0407 [Stanieria cyanosphaera PCC 7437]
MGLRYRKTVKLLPGFKLNLTQNGLASVSIGSRKINIHISRNGIRANLGFLKRRLANKSKKKFN